MELRKDFNFTAGDLGDALAFIVSQMEHEQYILEYVHYYAPYWLQGVGSGMSCTTRLSIVKLGYEDLFFIDNYFCPWMKDKVSHPITCISKPHLHVSDDYYRKYDPYRNREGNFETEFQSHAPRFGIKVNPFPYLNEFVDELATLQATRKLTKEEIMQLAQRFVTAKLESENEDKAVLERKQNGDLKQ